MKEIKAHSRKEKLDRRGPGAACGRCPGRDGGTSWCRSRRKSNSPTDPAPLNMVETVVTLKPPEERKVEVECWYSAWAPAWLKRGGVGRPHCPGGTGCRDRGGYAALFRSGLRADET